MADIDQISVLLNKLQSNYTELANKYFDIFFNSTPTDVTLEWYDESGVLQTIIVPNRAKDFTYFRNGIVDPEGVIVAPKSTIYQNINTGEVFVKIYGTDTASGWFKIINEASLAEFLIRGNGSPSGQVTAKLGTLYIDGVSGVLYIKTTPTSSTGWQPIIDVTSTYFVHFIDLGETVVIDV